MVSKILIANDGSKGAGKALAAALGLAKRQKTELHMICVEELPRLPATMDEVVEEKREADQKFVRVLADARMRAKSERVKLTTHVVAGHPVPTIVDFIKDRRFELLVIGYMGHSALYNRVIGSTTDRLVELAPCSVLVVK